MPKDPTLGWLTNGLKHEEQWHRRKAELCRKQYTTEPIKSHAEAMAKAHLEAARVFREHRMKIEE